MALSRMALTSRRMLVPMARNVARFSTAATEHTSSMSTSDFALASKKPSGYDLPPMNSIKDVPQQGWSGDTIVRQSTVAAAGKGRFAVDPVQANAAVISKPLVPMSKVESLQSLTPDVTITFESVGELEKYIEMAIAEGGHSREEVLDLYEHFMYGFDGKRACLNMSTWTVNHSDHLSKGLNIEVHERTFPGGNTAYVGEAMCDIQPNDEFYMDYRRFKLPEFYMAYTRKHGFKDVRTATMEAVYDSFDLGPENAKKNVPQQGWQCDTIVKQSSIPGAGNGRYAAEVVKKSSAVIQKPLVPMAQIDALRSLPNDVTITFETEAELEKYIDMAKKEGGHSREKVLDFFENFIYGFDGKRACLNVSTWTVNHSDKESDGLNTIVLEKTLPGGAGATAYVGEATTDIQPGDELFMDYRRFKLPEFYVEYTKKHDFKDVRTVTMEAAYGRGDVPHVE